MKIKNKNNSLKTAWEQRSKLRAKGYKLYAEGDLIWVNAVIAERGPKCTITYDSKGCTLGSGEKFYLDN